MHSVFVSSTFRDMHFERDVLNRTVSTRLNHRLRQYNQSVRLLDLRWGVDTSELSEEEATQRVLRVCFDSIDSCRPYMVILLGDRYGYIPDGSDISVTHMEILRGAIESAGQDHVFVYFREADYSAIPDTHRPVYCEQALAARSQLSALKEELLQTMPQCCRTYHSRWSDEKQLLVSEDFEQLVYADLSQDLVQSLSLKQYRSELEKQLAENDEILRDNLQNAYCDEQQLQNHLQQILHSDTPFGIIAQAGAGKSIYLSLICSALRQAGQNAYILFCGDNAFSASVRNAAEMVLYCLTPPESYDYEANSQLSYDQLLQKLIAQREKAAGKTYLLLDAVDKCEEGMLSFLKWCQRFLSETVVPVFSSRQSQELDSIGFRLDTVCYSKDARKEIAGSLLGKYGKSVNALLLERIADMAKTPLHLHILLLLLLNMDSEAFAQIEQKGGGMDAINAFLQDKIEQFSQEPDGLLEDYLFQLLDHSQNPDLCVLLLGLLVFSDRGLQETELQGLIDYTTMPWIQMDYMAFLAEFFFFIRIRENGRLDISHDVIRQALRSLMTRQCKTLCGLLTDYFFQIEEPEAVANLFGAVKQGKFARRLVEYLAEHRKILSSIEPRHMQMSRQLRHSMTELFLPDEGRWLILTVNSCQSLEEVATLQSVLTSSLLATNDYLSVEQLRKILVTCMTIPTEVKGFPTTVAELELISIEKFYQRHNITDPQLLELLENFRKTVTIGKQTEPAKEPKDPMQELLDTLKDPSRDFFQRIKALQQLCSTLRKMAGDQQTADKAITILPILLEVLEKEPTLLPPELQTMMQADIYTSLGLACKTTRSWEEGIRWDEKSRDLYAELYRRSPTAEIFRKYRERVYNVANIVEAWAMEKQNDPQLWDRTRECYAQVYELEMVAIAHGVPDRELIHCASSILSYGTALINSGRHEEGIDKYQESLRLVGELVGDNPRPDLYLELYLNLLECAGQLCLCKQFRAAFTLCRDIAQCIERILRDGQPEHRKQLMHYTAAFSNHINQVHAQLGQQRDLENMRLIYEILDRLYTALIPMEDPDILYNVQVVKRNIGNLLLQQNEYAQAYQVYCRLLELVRQYDLPRPDSEGHYQNLPALSLINVLERCSLCLRQMDDQEVLVEFLDQLPDWASYLSRRSESLAGDPARILYVMSRDFAEQDATLSLLLLIMAGKAIEQPDYDRERNQETTDLILTALSQLGNDEA